MRFFLVFLMLLTTAVLQPSFAAKRVALVIGNSDYQHVTKLVNPRNDADLMSKVLKEAGFEVTLHHNLDQRGMKKALLEYGRTLTEGVEASMVFYAGHGIEVDGVNYLVPVDSNMLAKDEADLMNIALNNFLSQFEKSSVPLNIIVLDACRNNPFRSLRALGNGGLAPVSAPSGTYVAYATSPGAVAADGEGTNSPFTKALAESIGEPGLALETVFKRTREKVKLATNGAQLPFDNSAITGEFYFRSAALQPPVAVAPLPSADKAAEAAFTSAGDNVKMLQIIVDRFPGTVWAELAAAKIGSLAEPTPEKKKLMEVPDPEPVLQKPAPVAAVKPNAPEADSLKKPLVKSLKKPAKVQVEKAPAAKKVQSIAVTKKPKPPAAKPKCRIVNDLIFC